MLSPKSEGCIIATSGGRPEEVIENTGRIRFWRRTSTEKACKCKKDSLDAGVPRKVTSAGSLPLNYERRSWHDCLFRVWTRYTGRWALSGHANGDPLLAAGQPLFDTAWRPKKEDVRQLSNRKDSPEVICQRGCLKQTSPENVAGIEPRVRLLGRDAAQNWLTYASS